MRGILSLSLAPVVLLSGCLGDSVAGIVDTLDDLYPSAPEVDAVHYDIVDKPYTTLQAVWAPKQPDAAARTRMDDQPGLVTQISEYESLGLGVELVDGEPWIERNDLAPGYKSYATWTTNPAHQSLLYFWQSADQQLIDEESPIRYAGVYVPPFLFASAYRPQSHLTTHAWEAHVRTARAIAEAGSRNFDFSIVTGDMTDGGQENELQWFVDILNGGEIDPDSGVNDDPIEGPGNDFNDPFLSVGINTPWYAVIGNHETLYIGSSLMNDEIAAAAVSDEVFTEGLNAAFGLPEPFEGVEPGYRDGSRPDAPVVTSGKLPPDPKRKILDLPEVLEFLQSADGEPAGHGLTAEQAAAGNGDFTFVPLVGKPIRVIALNTIYRDGIGVDEKLFEYSEGFVSTEQLQWLEQQLTNAEAAGELVIIATHHRAEDFNEESPISCDAFRETVGNFDNVALHITGHGHNADIFPDDDPGNDSDGCAEPDYYEVMIASTADFPIQSRIFELVYEGAGYLSIYNTNIDHNSPVGSFAHEGRELAAGRRFFQGADYLELWESRRKNRNLILRYRLPDNVADEIESNNWPTTIESTSTLANLDGP